MGGPTTDCMNAMVPEDRSQDISITLSVDYERYPAVVLGLRSQIAESVQAVRQAGYRRPRHYYVPDNLL